MVMKGHQSNATRFGRVAIEYSHDLVRSLTSTFYVLRLSIEL